MKKIKNMITVLGLMAVSTLTTFAGVTDTITQSSDGAATVVNAFTKHAVTNFLQPLGAAFIFVTVLLVGFDVIKNRGDAGKRTAAMSSLMWVAVGSIIIGSSLFIAGFLWSGVNTNSGIDAKNTLKSGV